MAYWLMKSEPDAWSWDQQVKKGVKGEALARRGHHQSQHQHMKKGVKGEAWTGVRNHQAKLNLMKMKKGDRAFFYHSNIGKEAVGILEIIREAYPDPSAESGSPWVVVDVKALDALPKPVSLDAIKAEPNLKAMTLVNNTR